MKYPYPKLPSNKKFGNFFGFVFFIISFYFFYSTKNYVAIFFLILSIIILIIAKVKPNKLFYFNQLWMKIGIKLGNIINPIILFLIFFGLFAPYGIIMKIFRRDELVLKLNKKNNTFWKMRLNDKIVTNFRNQF